jgi:hypothetical protein
VGVGEHHVAGERPGAVEGRETLEVGGVGGGGGAENEGGVGHFGAPLAATGNSVGDHFHKLK